METRINKKTVQPMFFLADSRPLFTDYNGQALFTAVLHDNRLPTLKAVYIGAANGDDPAFYQLFEAAMKHHGIENHYMINSGFNAEDRRLLEEADLILLAGGDVLEGWRIIRASGMDNIITRRYYEGAVLAGVSAGAIHLGLYGYDNQNSSFETLKLAPFLIGVHQQETDWKPLRTALSSHPEAITAIGLPAGSGFIYYPDQSIEVLARPISEFRMSDGRLSAGLIFPKQEF